jgi:hypothetical protein
MITDETPPKQLSDVFPVILITPQQVEFVQRLVMSLLDEAKTSEQFLQMCWIFAQLCSVGFDEIKKFKAAHGHLPGQKAQ